MVLPTRRILLAVIAAGAGAAACSQPSHLPSTVATSEGVTAYLGIVPSALVRAEHPERVLHPSAPFGEAHIVVALYDAQSGQRIENASVEAVMRGERHRGARRIRLEPMRIENTITYGGFVSLARNDRYHVDIAVSLQGSERPIEMQFLFDVRSLPRAGG